MPPRGKFSKPSRGGGKRFSRDVQPVDKHGNPVGLWRDPADDPPSSSSSEDEEGSEESGSEDESAGEGAAGPSKSGPEGEGEAAELSREDRRAAAKAKKQSALARRKQQAAQPGDLPPSEEEDGEEVAEGDGEGGLPANPNHTAKARSQLENPEADREEGDTSQLTRREREAIEAQQARERYMKMHAEGKTEEARTDLARLAIVREQREAERARKEVEKEEKAELVKERAAARERDMKMREAAKGKKKGGGKKK